MKAKMLLCLLVGMLMASFTSSSTAGVVAKATAYHTANALVGVSASTDTIYITGDDPSGATTPNAGMLENTINADTAANGAADVASGVNPLPPIVLPSLPPLP